MKAEDLVRDALLELGRAAAEQPIEADEFKTAIRYANRLFANFAFLELGFTPLETADDVVTIPAFAEEWAVKALAVRIAPQFSPGDPMGEIRAGEQVAYKYMLLQQRKLIPMSYPATLPTGQGNQISGGYDRRFYPESCDGVEDGQD